MNKSCDDRGAARDEHLESCQFTGAARKPEERTLLEAQAANGISSSNKLENMVGFQVLPDTRFMRMDSAYVPQFTIEAPKHQPLNNAAGLRVVPRPPAFLPKIRNRAAGASSFRSSYQALLLSRRMLVRGCIKLAGVIRRTAVACYAPSTGAGEDDDDLPYSQLDEVTHELRREAFGPLYLVT